MAEKTINNVDQIRELIFGPQIKAFEEKFDTLEKTVKEIEKHLLSTFREAHSKLQKETERSLEALEQKIDNLATATQKERTKLKELIDTADETLQTQIHNQKNELLTKIKIMKENIEDENLKMNDNLKEMKAELETSLNEGLANLSHDKLSRDAMAGMLLDVAMKIQGTDAGSILDVGSLLTTEESKPETK